MKIVVCVKIVQGELNPFDACSLECALTLDADITVLCMGPRQVLPALNDLTRRGNFRTILLSDPVFAGSDTLATSYILSKAIERLGADLVLCGRQTLDGDTGQVGPGLAARLRFPLLANVMKFSSTECVTRSGTVPVVAPSVLTIERINTLRFPSFRAKGRTVEIWDNSVLQADPARCGHAGSPTRVLSITKYEHRRRKCQFIRRAELVELVERLARSCDTVPSNHSGHVTDKFESVMILDREVERQAYAIAHNVEIIDRDIVADLDRLVDCLRVANPSVVLIPASLWGRRLAPQIAVRLETGLCADCTSLEKRGDRLIMRRPAGAGELLAEIECLTRPQMATVRCTESDSQSDIVLGCGRGIGADFSRASHWAVELSAELAVSRGLVDAGIAPYELQVGLTGRRISPKIYIAAGISGAVHHVCGVENSQYIIAINPDPGARIFEYADYGIVDTF